MVHCAILDTGVKVSHKEFVGKKISGFGLQCNDTCKIINEFEDTYGHGTAIFNILKNSAANFCNIKLEMVEREMSDEQLICALNYIYDNCDVDIINLSLGVTVCEKKEELYNACKKLYDRGVIIIAAFDNEGAMSYPAAFDCVIGVISSNECRKKSEYIYFDDNCINIGAKGDWQRLAWNKPEYVFMQGSSFACAHVTNQVICFMNDGIRRFDEILDAFKRVSKEIYWFNKKGNSFCVNQMPKNGRIAIFPFNKEMHSLVRFSHMLPYRISKIYDVRYTGNVGSTTRYILNDRGVNSITIENIRDIDFDAFDIFVFGHFEELAAYMDCNFKLDLLDKLIKKNKYVISFDELSNCKELNGNNQIYYPIIRESDVPPDRFGKLYRINRPVIGIFGTSSKQGKFTLQLLLREKFLKHGYNIGQIGTEPHSCMFGMDYVFPMGYNQSIYVNQWQIALYLNDKLKILCDEGRDAILIGSQAGTVPYDTGNLSGYTFLQNVFFQSTNPDVVILVINPYDDTKYVRRTIDYLQSGENTKVIAMVVFPMDIDEHWKGMNYKKHRINKNDFEKVKRKYLEFRLPMYMLGDAIHMEELFQIIIDYFSE